MADNITPMVITFLFELRIVKGAGATSYDHICYHTGCMQLTYNSSSYINIIN
jgi:hypothetical protein